jgi:hypothetical protein
LVYSFPQSRKLYPCNESTACLLHILRTFNRFRPLNPSDLLRIMCSLLSICCSRCSKHCLRRVGAKCTHSCFVGHRFEFRILSLKLNVLTDIFSWFSSISLGECYQSIGQNSFVSFNISHKMRFSFRRTIVFQVSLPPAASHQVRTQRLTQFCRL